MYNSSISETTHLVHGPLGVGSLLAEEVVGPHVVPGDVPRLLHDLRDDVLKEPDEHSDLSSHHTRRRGGVTFDVTSPRLSRRFEHMGKHTWGVQHTQKKHTSTYYRDLKTDKTRAPRGYLQAHNGEHRTRDTKAHRATPKAR